MKYDPITNQGVNPSILVTPWSEVSQLFLLTPDRRTATGYHVPRVDELFAYYKQHNLRTPMVFDIKDAATVRAVRKAAESQFGVASASYVAAKVNATLYTSRDAYRADGSGMVGIPVFTTNMLGKINVRQTISAWMSAGNQTMEINVKQLGGLLQSDADFIRERGYRVGVFQAIPDGPSAGKFYQNSGACCYALSDLYFSYSGGRDTADNRGNLDYIVHSQAFGLITTDDPKAAIRYLQADPQARLTGAFPGPCGPVAPTPASPVVGACHHGDLLHVAVPLFVRRACAGSDCWRAVGAGRHRRFRRIPQRHHGVTDRQAGVYCTGISRACAG